MAATAGKQYLILIALVSGAALGCFTNFIVQSLIPPDTAERLQTATPEEKLNITWPARDLVRNVVFYITGPLGEIFISLLFLGIIPLVFASLALGVTRLGGSNLGRIGFKTITYFILTTACAGVIGLTCVNQIRPGDRIPAEKKEELKQYMSNYKKISEGKPAKFGIETFVNIVPRNPIKAFAEKEMLAVIFTALLIGIALTKIESRHSRPLVELLEGVNAVTDFIIRVAMAFAPIGVFSLIFTTTALFGVDLLHSLAWFMATVLLGLALQLLIVFPILIKALGGWNPLAFFNASREAMITAFSTSSSSATLPTAIRTAEDHLKVPQRVSRFVLPLSASMNHNGTALFEAVTAVFLCQMFGVSLNLQQEIVVLILCVLTATGMAGVPGGSLPLIGLVIASVTDQVPAAAIGIVLGVDRILDMTRTMVNVTGDLTTALYVAGSEPAGAIPAPSP